MPLEYRVLSPGDAAVYRALRLGGLQESPRAFGSTYEEDAALPLAIDEAGEWSGLVRINLTVIEAGAAARRLYAAVGFVEFGREPDALRQNGVRDDVLYLSLGLQHRLRSV